MTRYHGTEARLRPGDKITPGHSNISGASRDSAGYAHSTGSRQSAEAYSRFKSGGSGGHVYEVEHTGPTERDPNDTGAAGDATTGARRSRAPLRVVREVGAPASPRNDGHWYNKTVN